MKSHIDLYNAIRNITKVPIVSYSSYRNNKNDYIKMSESTMLNPCLKDLGFSKKLEPNIVIQELELGLMVFCRNLFSFLEIFMKVLFPNFLIYF